jgi:hypothetical protein
MCNYKTSPQIHTFGADGGGCGGKNMFATISFIKININNILSIFRYIFNSVCTFR